MTSILRASDRPPTKELYDKGVLLVQSWLLLEGPLNVFLHKFLAKDTLDNMHDHPWDSVSYCLEGEMTEQYMDGDEVRERKIKAGDVVFRPARWTHRLPAYDEQATTLYITGPVVNMNWTTTLEDLSTLNVGRT